MSAWVKKRAPHLVTSLVFATIVIGYGLMALRFPIAYIWATYEDLFGEWIQFWSFVVALVLALRIVWLKSRYRLFFGLIALSCLYVAGEEISWGQRIIGFSSADFFKAHNLQGEANLHNFLTGPFSTTLKFVITYILAAALVAYGVIYPVGLRRGWRRFRGLDSHGLAAPPLYLWPYWVGAALLELGPFGFNEAEVAEIMVGFALVFMGMHYAFCLRGPLDTEPNAANPDGATRGLAVRFIVVTVIVLNLSALTTLSIYATDRGRTKILRRIDNGVEKFARRYARIERWETAIELYGRVLEKNDGSVSTRRKLAQCHRDAGNVGRFESVLNEALHIDLQRIEKDPSAASVNRSLVRTYRLMEDEGQAEVYLQNALRIGLARIKDHPTSANAAYSLGRTYALMEREAEALQQYARAVKLEPTKKKFKEAYIKAKTGRF